MLGPIIAAIIIIILIIYAAFPFLETKGFKGWANIALTSLILFTVIVTLFVVLGHRKGQNITFKSIPAIAEETATRQEALEQKTRPQSQPIQNQKEAQEEEESQQSQANQSASSKPQQEVDYDSMTDEDVSLLIAKEYLEAEEYYKNQGDSDYQQKAAQQIIDKYNLTEEDWQTFLENAAMYDSFNQAKKEMNK